MVLSVRLQKSLHLSESAQTILSTNLVGTLSKNPACSEVQKWPNMTKNDQKWPTSMLMQTTSTIFSEITFCNNSISSGTDPLSG